MSVEIERKGDRIILRSPYPTPRLGETVPGSRFSKNGGPHWSIPLTLDACLALRERFGPALRVGRDLSAWARDAITRQDIMAGLGSAADAELLRVPEVSPVLAKAMADRTYQRVGARYIATGAVDSGVLIADQPGLGKTLEAIGGIIESDVPGPYLVVCPKTAVESVWAREIPRWWPGAQAITCPDGRAKRDSILTGLSAVVGSPLNGKPGGFTLEKTFLVINAEMARTKSWWVCDACGHKMKWKAGPKEFECEHGFDPDAKGHREDEHEYPQLFAIEWGAIIVDESDRMLLRQTGTPTQVRAGAELLRVRAGGLRVAMSGTPFRSRPHLLWGTLNWLRPSEYSGFWRWAETFYEVKKSGWGGARTIGPMRADKQATLDRALSAIMLRRTKEEVAADLPPKTYVGTPVRDGDASLPAAVWLPMDPAQQRLYDKMQAESMVALSGGELNAIGILAEMTRLKQFASACGRVEVRGGDPVFVPEMPSNKMEYLWDKLEELGFPDDPETKVIVVSQFTALLNMFSLELTRRLGKVYASKFGSVVKLTGAVTGRNRSEAIDQMNAPVGSRSPHIMLMNIKAGGVAITLDTADHMFVADRTWIPDDHEQVEDRIHRVSRPRPVYYHYMQSSGSIEEAIAVVNAERAEESHAVLDGRRGLKYARQILEVMR